MLSFNKFIDEMQIGERVLNISEIELLGKTVNTKKTDVILKDILCAVSQRAWETGRQGCISQI